MSLENKFGEGFSKTVGIVRQDVQRATEDRDVNLLLHVLNVSCREKPLPCAYFDKKSETGCLALAYEEVRTTNPCPFYNSNEKENCLYPGNSK